jgi:hypothetical protein
MKFKKIIITIAVVFVVTIPATVFAARSSTTATKSIGGFLGFGVDSSKLTETQKADVSTYTKKMAAMQKEFINKLVLNGTLTKDKGTGAIQKIDNAVANGTFSPDLTGGKGRGNGTYRKCDRFGINQLILTDKQKADFKETYNKMVTNQKLLINKLVAANLITKNQAETATKRIDKHAAKENVGFAMYKGFMHMNMFGLNQSNLTTEQKAYFTDFDKTALELQKELVNKAVANGLLTKTQGDVMLQRLQNMPSDINSTNEDFSKGMKRRGLN